MGKVYTRVFRLKRHKKHTAHTYMTYRKILKISPGASIFQRPFLRGIFLEGPIFGGAYLRREICVSKSSGLALQLEGNLPFLLCFTLYLRAIFQVQAPGGAYIWRGDLTDGFLRCRFGGLIFGGAYFRNFTVFKRVPTPGITGKRGSANLWDCGISVYFDAGNMWATEHHYLWRSRNFSIGQQPDVRYVRHSLYNGKSSTHHYDNYDAFYCRNNNRLSGRYGEVLSGISRCSIQYSLYYTPPIINKQSSNIS